MPVESTAHLRTEERPSWVAWRRTQLTHAGFDAALAAELAAGRGVDVHALLDLVAKGCPPPLAVRILDPLSVTELRTLR